MSENVRTSTNRALLLEDDEVDRQLFLYVLNKSDLDIEFDYAGTFHEATKYLLNQEYDIVITDLNLPDSSGLDTVKQLFSHLSKTPVVILSGNSDEQLALQAVHAGAEDFISKEYIGDSSIIVRTLRHAMERHRLKVGLEETRDRERYLAHYDQITKLPNRLLFLDRISQAVEQARRTQERFALCFLDLDRFKSINDTLGHSVGDEVLRIVGERLKDSLRSSDTAARLGGDEFTFILRNTEQVSNIVKVADLVINKVNEPIQVGARECYVGASIGIACFPEHGDSPEKLLKNADMAMYEAKKSGRNTHIFFAKGMSEKSRLLFEIELALKETLQHSPEQLTLHFQPKLNLQTRKVESVEALLRWQHPEMGLVSPNDFIPLAEEVGLIHQIDQLVIQRACEALIKWRQESREGVRIAINISGRSFNQPKFIDQVLIPILTEHRVNASSIEIEITESVLIKDIETVQQRLIALKRLGFHITIDDFGTGFSSLSYLSNFPLDTLKIDGSFVCSEQSGSKEKAILKAIIALGHALDLKIVAECIETADQLDYLIKLGCSEGQGYFLEKPSADWAPEIMSEDSPNLKVVK